MYPMRPPRAAHAQSLAAVAAGVVSGGVVLWHQARVAALWDLSYILEHASRIARGDVPYRDFVIPHAPLTFLIQALLIRLCDQGLVPHAWYCASVAGLTVWLTVSIVRALWNTTGAWLAVVVGLPVVVLNGYAIFPQPFYDPDCVCVVLLAVWLILRGRFFVAGAVLAAAPFFKQNIGVAALVAVHGALLVSAARRVEDRRAAVWALAGSVLVLVAAAAAIEAWVGWSAYYHWTVTFAASKRWPSAGLVWSWYERARTWITPACFAVGLALVARRAASRWVALGAVIVMALPFADATHTMWRYGLSARSYCFWGLGAIAGGLAAVADGRKRGWPFDATLPLVAIIIAHAAFMSQGLYDSAYGVWPLLFIALTPLAIRLWRATGDRDRPLVAGAIAGFSALLLALGARHVVRDERLGFVDLSGSVQHAALPALAGLATPGTYVPDFEQLLRRTHDLIPPADGVVVIPGEDPFFFASGRRPQFPVTLFDDTVTPYTTPELMQMLAGRQIKWVIVKTQLQLLHSPWTALESFVARELPSAYDVVEVLPRYTIMRRR